MALNETTTPQENAETKEEKPQVEIKSSMEILSELFSTFDAEPPVIVKKEKDDDEHPKKHKKSKKKHKHKDKKDKKRKKKSKKKRKKSESGSDSSDNEGIDLSELIKTEITGTSLLSDTLQKLIKTEIKQEIKEEPKPDKPEDTVTSISEGNSTTAGENPVKSLPDKTSNNKSKIVIKDIKASSLLKNDSHNDSVKRKKHSKHSETTSKKSRHSRSPCLERNKDGRSRSTENSRKTKREDDKYHRSRDRSRSRSPRSKYDSFYDKYDSYKETERYKHPNYKSHKSRDDFNKERDDYKYRDDYRHRKESRRDDFYKKYDEQLSKDSVKQRDYEKDSRPSDRETRFDKKKLLEIARKNAIQMMKSGQLSGALTLGPQAQEKVIAAISGGGKTVEELTDFCKTLSKKEELGELSSVSSSEDSESEEEDLAIRHPFQIKDKSFTINIKNSVPLPTRTNQERQSELRIQFPVSSGQHHRKTESEWVPVVPKKAEPVKTPAVTNAAPTAPLAIEAAPPKPLKPTPPVQAIVPTVASAVPGPQVIPEADAQSEQEIASIVSQRLAAMRKLQENPNDSQAIKEMYHAQQGMNSWAESKLPLGHFTGTTGANILSQAQLASGYQAWARKDQLQTAAPVSGGMGMHLLQKMGWRPGEGLGKEKTGALEPLLLEVKLDKKGVIAKEECKKTAPAVRIPKQTVKTLEGKHPVSLLHEYASKRKLGPPEYILDFECGPDHMKNFLFKVILNGMEYKPNVASGNKKDAKALAATICLQGLGLLPS